jgi:tRNA G18 (ribose-2'-O)-methylase SpoU
VARLHLPGRIKSLNVSNAAALALYVVTKRLSAAGTMASSNEEGR